MINAERARIIDLIKLSVGLRIEIVAWNCGRSPAKLIYAFIGKVILEREDKLPAIPAYEGGEFQDSWVAPGGNEQHRVVWEDDYRECFSNNNAGVLPEFKDGSKQFWLYGLLRYYDPVSATEYDYRFCYRAFFSKIGVRFSGDGPDAYRGEIKL